MTPEQQKLIDQARRYAEQDEYVVTRAHIRNLLAIIEQQRAEHIANSVTVCNVFAAFGEHYDERLSPAGNVRSLIERQAASVPDELIGAVGEIANSHTDNEGTDRPLWWIIDPRQMLRTDAHAVYSMFKGPFFSREAATEFMDSHKYRYGKNVLVYCGSCNDAPQFKRLYDISRRIAVAPEAPKS